MFFTQGTLYSKALANTQTKYLSVLSQKKLEEEEKKALLQAGFVLNYLIAQQAQLNKMLYLLESNKKAQAILERLCIKMEQEGEEFSQEAISNSMKNMYSLMQTDPAFKADLKKLQKSLFIKSMLCGISGVLLMLAAPIALGCLIAATGIGSLLFISIPLCIAVAFLLAVAEHYSSKNHFINQFLKSTPVNEYSCSQFYLEFDEDQAQVPARVVKTFGPTAVSELQASFFNLRVQDEEGNSHNVAEEVQNQYMALSSG